MLNALPSVSISVSIDQAGDKGHHDNSQVEAQTPVLQVVQIVLDALLNRGVATLCVGSCPTGDSHLEGVALHQYRVRGSDEDSVAEASFLK